MSNAFPKFVQIMPAVNCYSIHKDKEECVALAVDFFALDSFGDICFLRADYDGSCFDVTELEDFEMILTNHSQERADAMAATIKA